VLPRGHDARFREALPRNFDGIAHDGSFGRSCSRRFIEDANLNGELNALRTKLISLWNPPAAVGTHPELYVVTIRIRLARDRRLVGQPEVLTSGNGPLFE
jgi:hypothetical protein